MGGTGPADLVWYFPLAVVVTVDDGTEVATVPTVGCGEVATVISGTEAASLFTANGREAS